MRSVRIGFTVLAMTIAQSCNSDGIRPIKDECACAEALKGATGDRGQSGDAGAKGDPGAKGDSGAKGDVGERGPIGEPGTVGSTGVQGGKGEPGERGEQGPAGSGVRIAVLSSGDQNCPAGGASFAGSDGLVAYACNGTDGARGEATCTCAESGARSIKTVVTVPPNLTPYYGAPCPNPSTNFTRNVTLTDPDITASVWLEGTTTVQTYDAPSWLNVPQCAAGAGVTDSSGLKWCYQPAASGSGGMSVSVVGCTSGIGGGGTSPFARNFRLVVPLH